MTDVAIVGLHNTHVDRFLQILNRDQRFPDWRVTSVLGGSPARIEQLSREYRLDVVPDLAGLVGAVDAALLCDRDGRVHGDQAVPLLEAGVDVFVDKPLTTSSRVAQTMIAAAERGRAVLTTGSAFRYVATAQEVAARVRADPPRLISITGPADRDSEYAGLHFYGIHHVELLLEVLGNPHVRAADIALDAAEHRDGVVVIGHFGSTRYTLTFVRPEVQSDFRASVTFDDEVVDIDLSRAAVSYIPLMDRFVSACRERGPTSEAELLSPVTLMEQIVAVLDGVRPVSAHGGSGSGPQRHDGSDGASP